MPDFASKRALGYLNWTRNRHNFHRRDVLDVLVSDLQTQMPDHIAVTGDLVNLALEAEFAPALTWLEGVGTPDHVTVIPGNHDAYVRFHPASFRQSTFGNYLRGDGTPDGSKPFPFLRRRGPLALIGLSSAVPTPPLMATGRLGQSQLEALDRLLAAQLAAEPVFRVLLIHHPLRSGSRGRKRLTDSPQLIALLKQHGVELILHGHDHIHSTMWFDGPNGHDSGDRRALGVRGRPRPLSRRGLQFVFDRARRRRRGAASRPCGASTMPCASGNSIRRG